MINIEKNDFVNEVKVQDQLIAAHKNAIDLTIRVGLEFNKTAGFNYIQHAGALCSGKEIATFETPYGTARAVFYLKPASKEYLNKYQLVFQKKVTDKYDQPMWIEMFKMLSEEDVQGRILLKIISDKISFEDTANQINHADLTQLISYAIASID